MLKAKLRRLHLVALVALSLVTVSVVSVVVPASATHNAKAAALSSDAAGTLAGKVTDLGNGRPIVGAAVRAGGRSAVSGADGRYRLELPFGTYDVRVTRDGYSGATVVDRLVGTGMTRLNVGLPPTDPSAEAMRTTADLLRAERLRTSGGGYSAAMAGSPEAGTAELGPVGVQTITGVTDVPVTIRVLMPDDEIVEMEMETYLKGVVPSEMGYVFRRSSDALRAQAIASRTYAATRCLPETAGDPEVCEPGLDANVDTTTRTQVWRPVHYDVSDAAVNASRGQVVRHGGELVHALFHARSHANTLDSEDSRCCGGRSWPHLRSASSPDPFVLPWGHQAGMSQEGAAVLSDWGADAEEILRHFYASTTIDASRPVTPTVRAQSATTPQKSDGMVSEAAEVQAGAHTFQARDLRATSVVGLQGLSEGDGAVLITVESPVVESGFEYSALAVRWQGDPEAAEAADVAVRASGDGESWSDWTQLHSDVAAVDAPEGAEPGVRWSELVIERGRYAQLRATTRATAAGPTALDRVTLHYMNADDGPNAPEHSLAAAGLSVVARASWGANESYRFDDMEEEIWPREYHVPRAQIVHHTVTANSPADPASVVRSIYYYHAVTRGWGDIGYNFLVDHRGNVYEGRYGGERNGRTVRGGHALQFNEDTIGVAVLGTFTDASSQPTMAAENALVELLAVKCASYDIHPNRRVTIADTELTHSVLGHRDVLPGHTACPGDGLHARLAGIRSRVVKRVAQLEPGVGTTPTTAPRPTASRTPVPPATASPTAGSSATTLPEACVEMVDDGGFETLSTAWVRNRAYFTTWDVFSGAVAMFVGLRHDDPDERATYASVRQAVQLPHAVERAWLSFTARTMGYEGDRAIARLLDANGAIVALGNANLPRESQWTRVSYEIGHELASRGGEAVRLYFAMINDGDGRKSYLRLDDVSLVVCEPGSSPQPSPEPTSTATPDTGPTCVDVLADGSFDREGLPDWELTGGHPAARITRAGPDGMGSLRLGPYAGSAYSFDYAAAAQTFNVPGDVISATLSLRTNVVSRARDDAFVVELRKPSSGTRRVLVGPHLGQVGVWTSHLLPLDPTILAGEMELYLAVLNRAHDAAGGARTAVVVDDMSFEICFQPRPRASHLPWTTGTRH